MIVGYWNSASSKTPDLRPASVEPSSSTPGKSLWNRRKPPGNDFHANFSIFLSIFFWTQCKQPHLDTSYLPKSAYFSYLWCVRRNLKLYQCFISELVKYIPLLIEICNFLQCYSMLNNHFVTDYSTEKTEVVKLWWS